VTTDKPHTQSPYRASELLDEKSKEAALPTPPSARPRHRTLWIVAGVSTTVALLALRQSRSKSSILDAPPELLDVGNRFPLSIENLPVSTPLAPLLASRRPDGLTLLEPSTDSTRILRGHAVRVRFNRVMVRAAQVNQPLTESPVAFDPPVAGTTRWITRSTLSFLPEPSVFDHTTEARLVLNTQTLRSVGGESMEGMPEKTIVFAGGATVVPYLSPRRVLPGDPLSLVFSGRPDLAAVSSQMLTYESGGAQRSLRFSLRSRGQDAQGRSLVDVVLNRTLEPGARIAMLLSPPLLAPYDTGEGEYGAPGPSEVVVELRPRAKIEGFNCSADALDSEGCDTSETPTGILDIGDALRLLATNNLSDTPAPTVTVTPALPRQNVRIQGKRLVLTGDWEPGQVYEVRVAALKDTEGAVLAAVPPLAVRSRGLDPSVTLHAGLRAYEHDAPAAIVFNAVNVGNGTVRYVPLEPGRDLEVVLNQRYQDVLQNAVTSSMGPMAPTSRPNRWGRGIFSFIDPSAQRTSNIALVALQPSQSAESAPTYTIVQRTDLAISARVFQRGVLGWITSIATGRPVDNAQVQVLYGRAAPLAGHTDADGVVWIAAPPNVLIGDVPLAIGASKDSDRSVIRVDPNQSITPSTLGMPASAAARDTDSVAVLFADRGAYRPGDQLHTKIIVRQSPQCRPNARVPCNPDQLRPVMRGQFKVRVIGPTDDAALDEQTVRTNAWGTADTNFHIPASATPGEWRIEVREPRAPSRLLGSMTVTVAEFRPPTMRVDLTGVPATPHAGDPLSATIEARYLFGAVVGRARSNWTLTRRPINNYPLPWSQTYTFADIDSVERSATVAQGELELDATGHATLQTRFTTGSKSREEFTLETEVRDPSGESTAARRTVVVFPAQNEVGIRNTESWLGAGATLDVQAIVIDHVGAAVAGQSVTARIVREGWANYYEWAHPQSDESEAVGDGEGEDDSSSRPAPSYHARRARDEREVARCNLVSDREPIHCRFTPTQPGTYRLEARIVDSSGRETLASDRVYVAAPGEQADRDPPGAPITLSPSQSSYAVGDTARIAFESPWSDAEMLITVAREGVFRTERRRVQAGGNVVEFALTAEMVPNVFAQLSLVRPRTGAPEQGVDLNAPDLRVGACEIGVRPRVSALNVAIALPSATARPGDEVPVEVSVRNADGQPVRSEVALYAVDEGTLRLTSYETPRPGDSFFPRKPARFVLEDLRRVLVSRTELVALPGASGDGSDEGERAMRDERERFDPTPMWLPHLVVGADGIARGRLRLPERPTQYRIIAVANDSGIRTGGASTQLTATRPVVIRPTMPTSVVEGDRFEAVAFVHNPGTEPITAQVKLFLGTQVLADQSVALGAGADSRVSIPVSTTPGQERVELRFEATAQGSTDSRTSTVAVTPRGIIQRAWLAGPVRHERSLEVALGADALSRGANLQLTVASHPFVGLEAAYQAILDAPSRDVDTLVAQIRAYVAYAAIAPTAQIAADTRRRGEQALTDLASHLSESGAIDQQSTTETHSEYNRVEALEAVQAALDAGWTAPPTLKQRLGAGVAGALANGSLNDYESVSMNDLPAFAVHTLGHAGRTQALRMASLYEQKTSLSLFGLSQLALGMPSTDRRRETILREAIQRVMPGLNASNANYISPFANSDPNLTPTGRWSPTNNGRLFETSNRTLAALQLAAVEILPSLTEARAIARVLLQRRYEGHWGSTQDNAWVLTAMAAYAKRYSDNQPPEGSVTLDGVALTELAGASRGMRTFTLPSATVTRAGTHRLTITSESPAFFALSGRWYRAPNAQDQQARGATVALHRVIERENGTVLADGGHVRIGELLRVRLYMFAETILSPVSVIRDPLAGGVIAVDRGLDNTPQASLDALMGTTPEDQTIDPRTYLASQSLPYVSRRLFGANDTRFVIERAPSGLHEFTYAVRATTPGTFTVLPAEVNSPYVRNLVARSTVTTIVIDP
jgi:uncharacterized protein YfaS (alpha-2-macroglobulin family)